MSSSLAANDSLNSLFLASRSPTRLAMDSCIALYCRTISEVMSNVSSRCCSRAPENASLRSRQSRSDLRASIAYNQYMG